MPSKGKQQAPANKRTRTIASFFGKTSITTATPSGQPAARSQAGTPAAGMLSEEESLFENLLGTGARDQPASLLALTDQLSETKTPSEAPTDTAHMSPGSPAVTDDSALADAHHQPLAHADAHVQLPANATKVAEAHVQPPPNADAGATSKFRLCGLPCDPLAKGTRMVRKTPPTFQCGR